MYPSSCSSQFDTYIETFADALKYAWAKAKAAITARTEAAAAATKNTGWVTPNELATGDTIKVANLWGLKSDKVIASIKPASLGFAGLTIRFNDGSIEVFSDSTVVQRVAVA